MPRAAPLDAAAAAEAAAFATQVTHALLGPQLLRSSINPRVAAPRV